PKGCYCQERIELFEDIQKKWQDGNFKNDWTIYLSEKSATETVSTYKAQRNYLREISSNSVVKTESHGPSTPNRPIVPPDLK
ncbi:22037_t:CDS:2, partial [Gigaspora rosea]